MVAVKQVIMDIACDPEVDAAEQVKIALSKSAVFTNYDLVMGGCAIVGEPTCEASWSAEEYERMTGIDVMDLE